MKSLALPCLPPPSLTIILMKDLLILTTLATIGLATSKLVIKLNVLNYSLLTYEKKNLG